jgi:hypothetical protein
LYSGIDKILVYLDYYNNHRNYCNVFDKKKWEELRKLKPFQIGMAVDKTHATIEDDTVFRNYVLNRKEEPNMYVYCFTGLQILQFMVNHYRYSYYWEWNSEDGLKVYTSKMYYAKKVSKDVLKRIKKILIKMFPKHDFEDLKLYKKGVYNV